MDNLSPLTLVPGTGFVLLHNPRRPEKVPTAGNMTLDPEARREIYDMADKVAEDAINLIIQNPVRLSSMQEFQSYLEAEVNDVVQAITRCDIHKTNSEAHDLQVKLFALLYLSKNIVAIKRFGTPV